MKSQSRFAVSAISQSVALAIAASAMLAPALAEDTVRVIVAYKSGFSSAMNAESAVLAGRGQVQLKIAGTRAMAVEMPASAVAALRKNPHVEYVEEDVKRYPLSLSTPSTGTPYLAGQQVPYGIKMVQADQLPSGDSLVSNRKICIIDSGYDRAHEDLAANNVSGEYDPDGSGWWYSDEKGHGTHVAGTIAAINNSGVGVVGVNPNKQLRLHIVKVFGKDGWTYSSSLANAANKCKAAGANVVTMSLGGGAKSTTEQRAFDSLQSAGILSIAAAGNDGNTTLSYPASYSSVMSVAAIDENKAWASFSQYNSEVEIAAPGVGVLSTVPTGTGVTIALSVAGSSYAASEITGSPVKKATAALADFGIGDAVNSAAAGKVCLIARGSIDFGTKVSNCEKSGGVGAIVYNNVATPISATLGTTVSTIPSVFVSDVTGATLKAKLGQSATVALSPSNYGYKDGTSMATPHVSAVAALVWSYFPSCTGSQIRTTLTKSAIDLGDPGRDDKYGYGLIQARAAYDRIKLKGCGK
ncbi:S8 family serine peptidase [Chitinimonas sp.]|uniref:S8 family serine peptidase n=1 Tax=Chitinimonas sp. TaxID=1934313 RepID=UPI0035B0D7FB